MTSPNKMLTLSLSDLPPFEMLCSERYLESQSPVRTAHMVIPRHKSAAGA